MNRDALAAGGVLGAAGLVMVLAAKKKASATTTPTPSTGSGSGSSGSSTPQTPVLSYGTPSVTVQPFSGGPGWSVVGVTAAKITNKSSFEADFTVKLMYHWEDKSNNTTGDLSYESAEVAIPANGSVTYTLTPNSSNGLLGGGLYYWFYLEDSYGNKSPEVGPWYADGYGNVTGP